MSTLSHHSSTALKHLLTNQHSKVAYIIYFQQFAVTILQNCTGGHLSWVKTPFCPLKSLRGWMHLWDDKLCLSLSGQLIPLPVLNDCWKLVFSHSLHSSSTPTFTGKLASGRPSGRCLPNQICRYNSCCKPCRNNGPTKSAFYLPYYQPVKLPLLFNRKGYLQL